MKTKHKARLGILLTLLTAIVVPIPFALLFKQATWLEHITQILQMPD